jgi:hypothetical protein
MGQVDLLGSVPARPCPPTRRAVRSTSTALVGDRARGAREGGIPTVPKTLARGPCSTHVECTVRGPVSEPRGAPSSRMPHSFAVPKSSRPMPLQHAFRVRG